MAKSKERVPSAEKLAREACEEYILAVESEPGHPLAGSGGGLREAMGGDFPLFAQDVAELVALALSDQGFDGHGHVAAQSARRMLAKRPSWIRAANDWAGSAGLAGSGLEALEDWLSP